MKQMIINVIPQRLIRAADELDRSGKRLVFTAYTIEETIAGLRRSDDESMQVIAAKLTKMVENLKRKIRVIRMISQALYKLAELYSRTEDNIRSYEDIQWIQVIYRVGRISSVIPRKMIDKTFEKF